MTWVPWLLAGVAVALAAGKYVGDWVRGRRNAEARAAAAELRAAAAEGAAEVADRNARLTEERRSEPNPNADLDPGDVRERLLRAARRAGAADDVLADLGAVQDPSPDSRP